MRLALTGRRHGRGAAPQAAADPLPFGRSRQGHGLGKMAVGERHARARGSGTATGTATRWEPGRTRPNDRGRRVLLTGENWTSVNNDGPLARDWGSRGRSGVGSARDLPRAFRILDEPREVVVLRIDRRDVYRPDRQSARLPHLPGTAPNVATASLETSVEKWPVGVAGDRDRRVAEDVGGHLERTPCVSIALAAAGALQAGIRRARPGRRDP
jgi:hypothetical protein